MIALRLVKRPDGSVPALAPRPVDTEGLTIGRSPQCGLVLADPLRAVSRKHAWIATQRGGDTALLRCISTTTPLAVNGQQLAPGSEQVVKPGDLLRIGGFELQLEGSELTTIPFPVARASKTPPALSSPAPSSSVLPPVMPTSTATPLRQSRLDALWEVDTAPDPLGGESPLPSIGSTPSRAKRTPPDVLLESGAAASQSAPSQLAADTPAADNEALRLAFLRGAGLPDRTPDGAPASAIEINAEWMAHLGALLRATAEGMHALLNSRAVAKRSIGAEGTHIAARENNALKFAPDAAEALALLLRPHGARGFLDPVAALNDAYDDLQVHQLAIVAGMRAAIAQFDADFETVFGREFLRAYEEQARRAAVARGGPRRG